MSKLKNVEKEVREVLIDFPETRDSDDLLYLHIAGKHCIPAEITLEDFLTRRNGSLIPPFESVRRTRAKLQQKDARLRGKKYRPRQLKQDEYLEYVRGKDGRD